MGLLDSIDNLLGTRLGLLANDPRAAIGQMNQQAGAFNQASLLAVQAERNAMNGRPSTPEQLAAKQMVDDYTRDLAMGFAGQVTPTSKSALEIASKNAEKMLGLPKGNTAMDRAKALGFTESGYTGTNRDITAFDPLKAGASGSGSREGALGTWLTNDPRVASGFADWSARGQGGNVVYPLMIRGKTPKEFGSYAEIKDLVDANTQFARPPYRMMQDTINYENAKKALGDYGVLRNTMTDAIDTPITQYVVPDPSRLRSRFAAFDPARAKEPDILAAGIPFGILAGTNIEMPKKKEKRK
jgi:hypothetical protein